MDSCGLDEQTFYAIIYKKSGKYCYVNENVNSEDIFQKLTGLKISTGTVVITKNGNAVFVDGRYTLAVKKNIDSKKFEILSLSNSNIIKWIKEKLPKRSKIAYDPRFYTHNAIKKIKNVLSDFNFTRINLEKIFEIHRKKRELTIYKLDKSNYEENKLNCVYEAIEKNNLDAYLLCDPCSISWLLNIRDLDSDSLVVFGFLLITKKHKITMYADKLYSNIDCVENLEFEFKTEEDLLIDLQKIKSVGIDELETSAYIQHKNFLHVQNPCNPYKSIKNKKEISDIIVATQKDSVAIINFLWWINNVISNSKISNSDNTDKINPEFPCSISEQEAVEKLLFFRKQEKDFICESFPCIIAADENSSMPHYMNDATNNKSVENILLFDSGGQYKNGTTDITRTICVSDNPTDEQKLFYTLVLKGHIAVANAKVPIGTTGAQLDSLARQYLWSYSSDYNHSTGHGIGYMLNVHEGPISISQSNSVSLRAGMLLSNEPAYYKDNAFGIRLENMILVKENDCGFLSFDTISLVPFDLKLIDKKLLTESEKNWIDSYHKRVISELNSFLDEKIIAWLSSVL